MPRSGDLVIFVLTNTQMDKQNRYALPLVHVCEGNNVFDHWGEHVPKGSKGGLWWFI